MPAENLRSNLPFVTEVRDFLRLADTSDRKMAKPSYADKANFLEQKNNKRPTRYNSLSLEYLFYIEHKLKQ